MRHMVVSLVVALLVAGLGPLGSSTALPVPGTCDETGDVLQNDGDTGTDAGNDLGSATPTEKHRLYAGFLSPVGLELYTDSVDVYRFRSPPDESVLVNVTAALLPGLRVTLIAPGGAQFDVPPLLPVDLVAQRYQLQVDPKPGDWYLVLESQPVDLGGPGCPIAPVTYGGGAGVANYAYSADGCRPECIVIV